MVFSLRRHIQTSIRITKTVPTQSHSPLALLSTCQFWCLTCLWMKSKKTIWRSEMVVQSYHHSLASSMEATSQPLYHQLKTNCGWGINITESIKEEVMQLNSISRFHTQGYSADGDGFQVKYNTFECGASASRVCSTSKYEVIGFIKEY